MKTFQGKFHNGEVVEVTAADKDEARVEILNTSREYHVGSGRFTITEVVPPKRKRGRK